MRLTLQVELFEENTVDIFNDGIGVGKILINKILN